MTTIKTWERTSEFGDVTSVEIKSVLGEEYYVVKLPESEGVIVSPLEIVNLYELLGEVLADAEGGIAPQ